MVKSVAAVNVVDSIISADSLHPHSNKVCLFERSRGSLVFWLHECIHAQAIDGGEQLADSRFNHPDSQPASSRLPHEADVQFSLTVVLEIEADLAKRRS